MLVYGVESALEASVVRWDVEWGWWSVIVVGE